MLLSGLGLLLQQDALNLARLQLPLLTCSIPWHILRAYFKLKEHRLTWNELEGRTAKVLVHRRHRKSARPVVIAPTTVNAFAKDIDTQQELQEAIERGPLNDNLKRATSNR